MLKCLFGPEIIHRINKMVVGRCSTLPRNVTKQKHVCFYFQPVERETRHFNPLVIPAKLQKELPFKSKPKQMKKRTKPSLETKRAVVMEPHEKSVSETINRSVSQASSNSRAR